MCSTHCVLSYARSVEYILKIIIYSHSNFLILLILKSLRTLKSLRRLLNLSLSLDFNPRKLELLESIFCSKLNFKISFFKKIDPCTSSFIRWLI